MRRFSERFGYQPIRTVVQVEAMDDELRNSLWNLVCEHYFAKHAVPDTMSGTLYANKDLKHLVNLIWRDLFKQPTDTLGASWRAVYLQLREHFLTTTWHGVYDFVEFVVNNFPSDYFHTNE
jgi:AbiJ-like protein